MGAVNRRSFLKYSGAASMAGLAGCLGGNDGDFPSDDIRFLVPYAEGGGTDQYARGFAPVLEDILDTTVVVDNHDGASGMRAIQETIEADPDGHTIVLINPPLEVAPQLLEPPGFDQRDMVGIGTIGLTSLPIMANADKHPEPENGLCALIEKYRSGDATSVGGLPPGSNQDIFLQIAKNDSEFDWPWQEYVTYEGAAAVYNGTVTEVDAGIGSEGPAISFVESGDLVPVASLHSAGGGGLGVDTLEEQGYPNMDWIGGLHRCAYTAPETPDDIVQTWTEALEEATQTDEIQEWQEETGNVVFYENAEWTDEILNDTFDEFEERNVLDLIQ